MNLKMDTEAVRGFGRDMGRLAESLAVETSGAEASLTEVSAGADQKDVRAAVDDLLDTLKNAHVGVLRGMTGFGAELEMAADVVEETDGKLADKVPTD